MGKRPETPDEEKERPQKSPGHYSRIPDSLDHCRQKLKLWGKRWIPRKAGSKKQGRKRSTRKKQVQQPPDAVAEPLPLPAGSSSNAILPPPTPRLEPVQLPALDHVPGVQGVEPHLAAVASGMSNVGMHNTNNSSALGLLLELDRRGQRQWMTPSAPSESFGPLPPQSGLPLPLSESFPHLDPRAREYDVSSTVYGSSSGDPYGSFSSPVTNPYTLGYGAPSGYPTTEYDARVPRQMQPPQSLYPPTEEMFPPPMGYSPSAPSTFAPGNAAPNFPNHLDNISGSYPSMPHAMTAEWDQLYPPPMARPARRGTSRARQNPYPSLGATSSFANGYNAHHALTPRAMGEPAMSSRSFGMRSGWLDPAAGMLAPPQASLGFAAQDTAHSYLPHSYMDGGYGGPSSSIGYQGYQDGFDASSLYPSTYPASSVAPIPSSATNAYGFNQSESPGLGTMGDASGGPSLHTLGIAAEGRGYGGTEGFPGLTDEDRTLLFQEPSGSAWRGDYGSFQG